MRVIGIDPGTATLGYGVIDSGPHLTAVTYGVLKTTPETPMPRRLLQLHKGLLALLAEYQPTAMAVEQLFHARNTTTSIAVGQARGVVLLAAAECDLATAEYTPLQVKQAVVGYGGADKHQIQTMVQLLLKLEVIPRPDDAADALAIAICHLHSSRFAARIASR